MAKTMLVSHLDSVIGARHMVLHPLPPGSGDLDPIDVYRVGPCPQPEHGTVYPGHPATAKLYLCAEEYDKLAAALSGGDAYVVLDCADDDTYPVPVTRHRLYGWNAITGVLTPLLAPKAMELIKQIGQLEHQISLARQQLVPKLAELHKLLDVLLATGALPDPKVGPRSAASSPSSNAESACTD